MRSVGITLGSLESFMQMTLVLNLRQQLINAGFNNPEKTMAKFGDWEKLVNSTDIPALNELYKKTISGGYELEVSENTLLPAPAKTDFNKIQVNMNRIKNLLDYAFTMGHEMTHSFTDLYFYQTFNKLYTERDGRYMHDNAYTFFKEVIGVGWEISLGETRYGGLNDIKAARKYYDHIDVRAMDKVEPYINLLMKEWQKLYNSK